ncbi:T9SS type A sorting domain-containing protein [Dyadobacter subterraneus]|uniref:T9SS type A sorting domain-containing protein n=1 Tax=Dyadobacter subterraneus TaxID=2773304 RepID=A0ABR9W7N7_9BACT|nr:T9SS type A sorting domain-containing protein [Dyadobacter subterraneus]MBE9460416.1 T9SS type A sorting domain-containing protein [Dyadobacter subterraneus]
MKITHNRKNVLSGIDKFLFLTILILISSQLNNVYGQLKLVPLVNRQSTGAETKSHASARIQALSLPFFDDLSTTATSHPDSAFWMPGSGVYINNTEATTQPSVNMATFDGLDANGVPYNYTNQLSQGHTDTLTSQAINLAGLSPSDSVYLSFYWLAKGLGELPDDGDTLRLEFLGQDQQWVSMWSTTGPLFDSLFTRQFVAVTNPVFFHSNFQFRFRAYGRLSGPYDTWHLDYLYLNKGRSVTDRFIKDIAVRTPLTPFLRKYTAMPIKQYRANPALATTDSVGTEIINLFNNFNFTTFNFTVKDEISGKEFTNYSATAAVFIGGERTQLKRMAVSPIPVDKSLKALKLKYKLNLITTDDQNPTIPSVNLRRNDTISAVTNLSDYYAYDDGSAEYGVQVNQVLGRVAVRFALAQPDTLSGVRMSIVPFNTNVTGQSFTIQILSNKNGKPDQVLAQRAVSVQYASARDSLIQFTFGTPVALKDTFYVGWIQVNEQPLSLGYDRNSTLGNTNIFYNLGTQWVQETSLKGSVIIRPYMGGSVGETVTGTEPVTNNNTYFFPNPNKGIIGWNEDWIKKVEIYSVQGNLVRTILVETNSRSATVNELSDGMYIFKASDGKRSFAQKMLIVK